MPTSAYNKFNQFVLDCTNKVHNLGADTLKIALTNTQPVATNAILANITEISYTNCSTRVVTLTSNTQSGGVEKLILADLILTASGGDIAAFQWVVLYNDTPTSPAKPLIAWFDYGSAVIVHNGENITLDFDGVNGVLQLA